jgi:hypothetical protein
MIIKFAQIKDLKILESQVCTVDYSAVYEVGFGRLYLLTGMSI